MRTVEEHQDAVRALLAPLAARQPETVSFLSPADLMPLGADRVLAHDLVSLVDLPPFDNSQMDGYAVRSVDLVAGEPLRVARRIVAGHAAPPLEPGSAAPIMTGALMPPGADAVIPIEQATPDFFPPDAGGQVVSFSDPVAAGTFVRSMGSDLRAGELLLPAGSGLGPAQWGVIAASGASEIPLVSRIRVVVISTGDELRSPGVPLEAGQIHDSNGASMAAAIVDAGATCLAAFTAPDDAGVLRDLLTRHIGDADLILTTGGVSKGTREVVRDVFEQSVDFVSVAMQPGGPQGLGTVSMTDAAGIPVARPVVAFPGNPVSALVSFEVFLRPVLRELHGLPADRQHLRLPLAATVDSPGGKHQVRRGALDADGRVVLIGGSSSHLLHGYASSTLLVHLPVGVSRFDAGDLVDVWRIHD
ncbi:molybdopterin molybdotransferase [Mycetocola sp. CAN_C7]|uniref:molybdopterin molybdotransferase MoeA n=1 Tax=Mycetocola sp. CAN_C7 TaxID=2787724 RepID=UPI0018CA319A